MVFHQQHLSILSNENETNLKTIIAVQVKFLNAENTKFTKSITKVNF